MKQNTFLQKLFNQFRRLKHARNKGFTKGYYDNQSNLNDLTNSMRSFRMKRPVLAIVAGGTFGHIYPASAVVEEIKKAHWCLYWFGSEGGQELKEADRLGVPFFGFKATAVRGRRNKIFRLISALAQVMPIRRQLKESKINVLFATGGYVSFAPVIAAFSLRIPVIIHEQNARAGLVSRFTAVFSQLCCLSFEDSFFNPAQKGFQKWIKELLYKRTIFCVTGNPVRLEIEKCAHKISSQLNKSPIVSTKTEAIQERSKNQNRHSSAQTLLVLGGTRGAKSINNWVISMLQSPPDLVTMGLDEMAFDSISSLHIIHQAGQAHALDIQAQYERLVQIEHPFFRCLTFEVHSFIDKMCEVYQRSDCLISRAGALSLTEASHIGLPTLFIPYPFAADDHQWHNAYQLSQRQRQMRFVREAEKSSQDFYQLLASLNTETAYDSSPFPEKASAHIFRLIGTSLLERQN